MSTIKASYSLTPQTKLEIAQGDITKEQVDAIVNAANEHLAHGAGVAAAIASAGGPAIQKESSAYVHKHGPASYDQPAYTSAGKMPAKYVIHAVGPVWGSGEEDRKLAAAVYSTLQLADRLQITSLAFPAISTGIFGFPKDRAARIFFETFRRYVEEKKDTGVRLIRVILWDEPTLATFLKEGEQVLG